MTRLTAALNCGESLTDSFRNDSISSKLICIRHLEEFLVTFLMRVFVVGVGMTRFDKPGKDKDYTDYVLEAASKALIDANLTYDTIQFAAAGYCFGMQVSNYR